MSILPTDEFLSSLDPLDDPWPLYEGMTDQQLINGDVANNPSLFTIDASAPDVTVEQRKRLVAPDKGLKKMKISTFPSNSKKKREIIWGNSAIIENNGASSSSVAKKMDHNAKERIRRMNLNASYLALRALLPDSRRSKKRWSAPSVVDKVLKYIPELENEIEELGSKKEEMQSAANKSNIDNPAPSPSKYDATSNPTVSVRELNRDEAIVHISMDHAADGDGSAFANLLQRVEDEGLSVKSASTVYVCSETKISSSHLHIQMNQVWDGPDYIAKVKDKFVSWLR